MDSTCPGTNETKELWKGPKPSGISATAVYAATDTMFPNCELYNLAGERVQNNDGSFKRTENPYQVGLWPACWGRSKNSRKKQTVHVSRDAAMGSVSQGIKPVQKNTSGKREWWPNVQQFLVRCNATKYTACREGSNGGATSCAVKKFVKCHDACNTNGNNFENCQASLCQGYYRQDTKPFGRYCARSIIRRTQAYNKALFCLKEGSSKQLGMWGCDANYNTLFQFVYLKRTKQIRFLGGNGEPLCLEANSRKVTIVQCDTKRKQQQFQHDAQSGQIKSTDGRCLDGAVIPSGKGRPRTDVSMAECATGTPNQQWTVSCSIDMEDSKISVLDTAGFKGAAISANKLAELRNSAQREQAGSEKRKNADAEVASYAGNSIGELLCRKVAVLY